MSADNFVLVKKFGDDWRGANLSASAFWDAGEWEELEVPFSEYTIGPFKTYDEIYDYLDEENDEGYGHFIEYGIVVHKDSEPFIEDEE